MTAANFQAVWGEKNGCGVIHPAVHSFSVGNELDLDKYGMTWQTLIPDAVRVAGILHRLAPDHYITIPASNADEKKFYEMFRQQLPQELYQNRFYNSVQTFKLKDGDGLQNDILPSGRQLQRGQARSLDPVQASERALARAVGLLQADV